MWGISRCNASIARSYDQLYEWKWGWYASTHTFIRITWRLFLPAMCRKFCSRPILLKLNTLVFHYEIIWFTSSATVFRRLSLLWWRNIVFVIVVHVCFPIHHLYASVRCICTSVGTCKLMGNQRCKYLWQSEIDVQKGTVAAERRKILLLIWNQVTVYRMLLRNCQKKWMFPVLVSSWSFVEKYWKEKFQLVIFFWDHKRE